MLSELRHPTPPHPACHMPHPRFGNGLGTSFCVGFAESIKQHEHCIAEITSIAQVLNGDPREPVCHYCHTVTAYGPRPCCSSPAAARRKIAQALQQLILLTVRAAGDRVSTKAWLETPRVLAKVGFAANFCNAFSELTRYLKFIYYFKFKYYSKLKYF